MDILFWGLFAAFVAISAFSAFSNGPRPMTRIERIASNAIRGILCGILSIVASAAMVCWIPSAILSHLESPLWHIAAVVGGVLAFTLVCVGIVLIHESWKFYRYAVAERIREQTAAIRPRH